MFLFVRVSVCLCVRVLHIWVNLDTQQVNHAAVLFEQKFAALAASNFSNILQWVLRFLTHRKKEKANPVSQN